MTKEKDQAFYSKLWGLMIPILLQNLMLAMVAVADAFMLGGLNQNYMSAVSLATQIQFNRNHKVIFDYLFKSSYMPV